MKKYYLNTYVDNRYETEFEMPDDFNVREYMSEHNYDELLGLPECKINRQEEFVDAMNEDYYAISDHNRRLVYEY